MSKEIAGVTRPDASHGCIEQERQNTTKDLDVLPQRTDHSCCTDLLEPATMDQIWADSSEQETSAV